MQYMDLGQLTQQLMTFMLAFIARKDFGTREASERTTSNATIRSVQFAYFSTPRVAELASLNITRWPNSHRCRGILLGKRNFVAPVPGSGSHEDTERARRHDGLLPPLRGAGPLAPPGPIDDFVDHGRSLIEEIYLTVVEDDTDASCESIIRNISSRRVFSWQIFSRSLQIMLEEISAEDVQVLGDKGHDLVRALQKLQGSEASPFLQDISPPVPGSSA